MSSESDQLWERAKRVIATSQELRAEQERQLRDAIAFLDDAYTRMERDAYVPKRPVLASLNKG